MTLLVCLAHISSSIPNKEIETRILGQIVSITECFLQPGSKTEWIYKDINCRMLIINMLVKKWFQLITRTHAVHSLSCLQYTRIPRGIQNTV